uniref:G_PROTEIN_RECEP_F1_2 domain-containing protein n=1 Tax=Globodera pallida TaxID=36090 RepID=A0A183CHB7_GLOPA
MEAAMPECLRQSPQQCREIQIDAKVPIEWALPLYGFLMPLIVAITILTNSFIVVVLSHRSLRTPTNFVLGAMAITELLTGLLCLPWLLYYYTFGGYLTDEWQGLPAFWCTLFPYLATSLPSIFHTVRNLNLRVNECTIPSPFFLAAIWLTVYLAVQRYIYICVPKLVQSLCTIRRSKQMIVSICVLSMWVYAPELFASYNQSFQSSDPYTNRTRSMCVMYQTALIQMMGNNLYHMLVFAVHTIIVHTLPCILLVFFTWRLIAAIRKADKKHCNLIGK